MIKDGEDETSDTCTHEIEEDLESNKYPYVDIDPISYISNLILQFSRFITKGKGLSKRGVNAFLLLILTSTLLFTNTKIPEDKISILKLYWVPLLFFIYFLVDMLKTNDRINNMSKRLYQRTEFVYYQIIKGNIDQEDLLLYLRILSFNKQQLETIIHTLHKRDMLAPLVQINLLHNSSIYKIGTTASLKESLLAFEWCPAAVCTFIHKSGNLTDEYIIKLISKYGDYPSVLFALGYYQKFDDSTNDFYRLGNNFQFKKSWFDFLYSTFKGMMGASLVILIGLIIIGIYIENFLGSEPSLLWSRFIIAIICIIIIEIIIFGVWGEYDIKMFEKQVDTYLTNNLEEDIEEIYRYTINDLVDSYSR